MNFNIRADNVTVSFAVHDHTEVPVFQCQYVQPVRRASVLFIYDELVDTIHQVNPDAYGFVMAAIITVPPWPMYRRKPLDWQTPRTTSTTKLKKKK
ncbi:uncharacterized protein LOC143188094 isoform X1 [Calliopsis andreniformis]|uniref:uncharacterized protein LOC143188094 isoform X1 n=1 Tax=Calliopsis andreniformis TaxID=337506 RepID=UPI003FCCC830